MRGGQFVGIHSITILLVSNFFHRVRMRGRLEHATVLDNKPVLHYSMVPLAYTLFLS